MKIFAQRLKKLREEKGLSQRELAKQINIAHSTLGMYEIGEREPDFNTVSRLAAFFNTSVDYLLGRTDDPHPQQIFWYTEELLRKAAQGDKDTIQLLLSKNRNNIISHAEIISEAYPNAHVDVSLFVKKAENGFIQAITKYYSEDNNNDLDRKFPFPIYAQHKVIAAMHEVVRQQHDSSTPSWWYRDTPPTNVELEEFLYKANIHFNGAPLDEDDKEDILTYLRVKWEREKRKREREEEEK